MRLSTRVKRKIPRVHSITLYRTAILMLLAPVAMAIFAWLYGWGSHDTTGFSQQMVDKAMYILEKEAAPAVGAAFLSFFKRWDDEDGDGKADVDQQEGETNENLPQPRP